MNTSSFNIGQQVYVRWYGKTIPGTVKGQAFPAGTPCMQRMLSVEIPVQGVAVLTAFMPEHIYDTAEKAGGKVFEPQQVKNDTYEVKTDAPKEKLTFEQAFRLGLARKKYKDFLQAHWDHERNHLKTAYLQEAMQLFNDMKREELKSTTPKATVPCASPQGKDLKQPKKKQQIEQLSLFN